MAAHTSYVAERFVAAINAHDIEQLLALMTSGVYADNEPLRERMRASRG